MSDELEETAVNRPANDRQREDPAPAADAGEIDTRVLELVDGFFERIKAGENPDAELLIQQHPELAEELKECIDSIRLVNPIATEKATTPHHAQRIGDFQILREVGRGGMGVVYEAEQISLRRRVALKLLRHAIADPEAMERFQREAETVANLQHSNIVPIYAVGEESGQHYFAMQFIEGESLADVARGADGLIEALDIADWGLQTAEALAYSHEHDIIHRDVKPSNLIRDPEGKVWLTDFGLAKRMDDLQLSMTGAILGTPRYMSPEQASSMRQPVDHRTDIYSLGATMYELATGKPLFDADSPHVALGQIISEDPAAPRSIRPTLPLDLDTIITRCISKHADDRYSSAQELVHDLRAFIDGRAIASRRPSWTEQLGRWRRKNKRAISVAASAAAIAAVLVLCIANLAKYSQTSKLARIRFDVGDSITTPLVAEILDERGEEAVPSFTVPTQQKVEIPQGDYHLLLRGRGQLSETYNFSAYREPMQLQELIVRKEDHKLWEPKKVEGHWRLWDRPDGDDLVVFELDGVRALDGVTSNELWYTELQQDTIRDQLSAAGFEWKFSPYASKFKSGPQAKLVQAADEHIDINADGVDDLILAFNTFPTLLALSGVDGKLIWAKSVASRVEDKQQKPMAGAVIGTPIVRDIDGDDVPDVVGVFAVKDSDGATTSSIVAISGKSGETIWQYKAAIPQGDDIVGMPSISAQWFWDGPQDLSRNWHQHFGDIAWRRDNGNGTAGGEIVPFDLDIVTVNDRDELVFVCGKDCFRLDLATGREMAVLPLGLFAATPPHILPAEDTSNGQPSILLCEQQPRIGAKPQLRIKSCDLLTGKEHWSTTVEAYWLHCAPDTDSPHNWPLVIDLDGDGIAEIVVPDGSTTQDSNYEVTPAGSLQVLDSRTGQRRWTDPDTAVHVDFQLNHFVATDDLDNDGIRDVASVSFFRLPKPGRKMTVFVDVFSGADGKRLFFLRSPQMSGFRGRLGQMALIRSVSLIGDALLVDFDRRQFQGTDSGSNICFSLSERKMQFVGDEMANPVLADVDNDDEFEFIAWRPVHRERPAQGGKLVGFKRRGWKSNGELEDNWQYAGQGLHPIGDVDNDGVDDAFRFGDNSRNINMVSGATGQYVWSEKVGTGSNRDVDVVALGGDLDGDGAEDLLIGYQRSEKTSTPPVEARSGRTGERFWQFQIPTSGSWERTRSLGIRDLDKDGRLELLIVAQSDQTPGSPQGSFEAPIHLYCLDANNGNLRWSNNIQPRNRYSYWLLHRFRSRIVDVDQNGVLDIVTYGLRENGTLGLQAISGVDGRSIWQTQTIQYENEATPRDTNKYPWFETFDSKHGTIALLDSDRNNARLFGIDLATGKPRWKWEAKANGDSWNRNSGNPESGSTMPIRFRTKNGDRIGFWYSAEDGNTVFKLLRDEGNKAHVEQSIQLAKRPNGDNDSLRRAFQYYLMTHRALAVDLNGDEVDELIYTTPTNLVARSLDSNETLWSVELPSTVHEIKSVQNYDDGRIEIVVAVGEDDDYLPTLLAYDQNGEQIWAADVPGEDAKLTNTNVLGSQKKTIPPRILVSAKHSPHTWCVPTKPSKVQTASTLGRDPQGRDPQRDAASLSDPRLVRDLPWGGREESLIEEMVPAFAVSLALLGLPLYYVSWLLKGRWSLRTLLVAPVVAAIWLSVARSQAVVAVGMSPIHPLLLNLMVSLFCLPTIIYVYVAARIVWNRDWKRLRQLVTLYLAVAFLMATWMLWMTGFLSDPEPIRINWTFVGVTRMLYYGVGATGLLLTLGFVGKKIFKFAANRFRHNAKLAAQ